MKLYLIGLPGSGKSFLGKRLASLCQLPFFDLDAVLESQEGMKVPEIFSLKGEEYFRTVEAAALRKVSEVNAFVMATGGGTPCFYDGMKFINQQGTSIFLNPPLDEIVQRLGDSQKKSRPLLASASNEQLKEKLEELFQRRHPFYEQANLTLSEMITPEQVMQLISKK